MNSVYLRTLNACTAQKVLIYNLINDLGFPRLLSYGYLEELRLNYIVMTKFDADLESLFT